MRSNAKQKLTGSLCALAALIALGAHLSAPAARSADADAPPAALEIPAGVSQVLHGGNPAERLRVSILLADQPLVRVATRPALRRRLALPVPPSVRRASARSPARVTAAERRFARRAISLRLSAIRGPLRTAARRSLDGREQLIARVRELDGEVLASEVVPAQLIAVVPRRALESLAAEDSVQAVEPAPLPEPQLATVTPSVGAPAWHAAGHTGGGGSADGAPVTVSLEGVPNPTHPAFAGIDFDVEPWLGPPFPQLTPGQHGTQVAGAIGADAVYTYPFPGAPHYDVPATYRGTAPGIARFVSGYFFAYPLGLPSCGNNGQHCNSGAPNPANIFNYSAGGEAIGDDDQPGYDRVPELFGIPLVASAGNSGPSPQTTLWPAIGRNVIAVGATDSKDTVDPTDDTIYDFSSRGPTIGGRKKPDLVAPGRIRTTSNLWNQTTGCNLFPRDPDGTCPDFVGNAGTSFSAPLVTGAAALLYGAGIVDPRATKAILVNSARPMSWLAGGQVGWRPDSGWGQLDLDRALAERAFHATGTVAEGGARYFRATVDPGTRATLTWFQRSFWHNPFGQGGSSGALIAFTTSNLDLRQRRASDLSLVPPYTEPASAGVGGPDSESTNDTVERVYAPAEGTQQVIYEVKAPPTVVSGVEDCDPFTLVCTEIGGGTEAFAIAAGAPLTELQSPEVRPVEVERRPPTGDIYACGEDVEISAKLTNGSADFAAESARVELDLPAGVQVLQGQAGPQQVGSGTLATGQTSAAHQWVLRPLEPGEHTVAIVGRGETLGSTFTYREELSLDCEPDPPQVLPVAVAVTKAPCGQEQTLTARLTNASATFAAAEAQVSIALPAGVQLISGPATQSLAGGALGVGETSAAHSWRLRAGGQSAYTAVITGRGSAFGQSFAYPHTVVVGCNPPKVGVQVFWPRRPRSNKVRVHRGAVVFRRAELANLRSAPKGTPRPTGRVLVRARQLGSPPAGKRRRVVARWVRVRPAGYFGARLRVCRRGRYRLTAYYPGDSRHTARTVAYGQILRVPRRACART